MRSKLVVSEGQLYKKAEGQPGQGPSFEQQFGILANAQITDKYPSLSKYLVAVQLVDKSDDNSFAVCIIIYKLGKNYIYVPAVFRGGKIHTGQIMQVPSMQRLLPLSDAWLGWVKNKDVGGDGELIPSSVSQLYGESAASARSKAPVDPIMKSASMATATVFDTALKLGKKASEKLMDLLADTDVINTSFKFYTPEQIKDFVKQAVHRFPDEAELQLITPLDKRAELLTPEQLKALYADGFVVKKDNMVDWGPAQNDLKVAEVKNLKSAFVIPDKPCKCQALSQDGELKDIIFLPISERSSYYCDEFDRGARLKNGVSTVKFDVPARKLSQKVDSIIVMGGRMYRDVGDIAVLQDSVKDLDSTVGISIEDLTNIPYDNAIVTPQGKILYGFNGRKQPNGDFCDFDKVLHITDDQNLKNPLVFDHFIQIPQGCRVLFNTQLYDDKGEHKEDTKPVCCDPCKLVLHADLGKAIERFCNKNCKRLKVSSDGQEITVSGDKSDTTRRMQVKEAVLHLVQDYGITPLDAKTIVKRASGSGSPYSNSVHTYTLFKTAAELPQSDMWEKANIGFSQVPQKSPDVTDIQMQSKAELDPQDQMDTIQKATDAGIKEVFDTQILKLLVKSADPHSEVLDALPDFMNTLDKLCKMLFLYRCHMKEMEQKYGAVKLKALQMSLRNTLHDLSQLTVFLKLRSGADEDSPDAGDLQTGTQLG